MTQNQYILELLARRKALKERYDALLKEPQSYSISGSVSATNQTLAELRVEIAAIEQQLAQAVGASGPERTSAGPALGLRDSAGKTPEGPGSAPGGREGVCGA